eukprot:CAMPEP_0119326472 /NCGR_PEP_ID=MMETSP1333-20130426/68493_1 /TAXON_ID=418940 /ORGANISM="Scyphosphaera apsteinii, Strain RCC1455" /LENGTH=82 /DNA_ID=CAMNT_0007334789 /DNA_START=803 /DNA_END=1051 /DNA_ORIENTATION=+
MKPPANVEYSPLEVGAGECEPSTARKRGMKQGSCQDGLLPHALWTSLAWQPSSGRTSAPVGSEAFWTPCAVREQLREMVGEP